MQVQAKGLASTSPNEVATKQKYLYPLSHKNPHQTASAFYYSIITSLPPIAKGYLAKVTDSRREGKVRISLKE